jgi:hypothetical protein
MSTEVKTVAWRYELPGDNVQFTDYHDPDDPDCKDGRAVVYLSAYEAAEARAQQFAKELGECSGGYQTLEREVAAERARAQRAEQALRELVEANDAIDATIKNKYDAISWNAADDRYGVAWAAARAIVESAKP